MPAAGEHHPAFEEYCECIFELAEDEVRVIQARIAERLQVSRPAVSEMVRKLEAEGLITNDHSIVLTEAGKWEHVISEQVEVAMNRLLGDPTTCPHGNPIPGSEYVEPDSAPLSSQPVGESFTVRRIPEELEFTPGLLEFLEQSSLRPGCIGVVTGASPDGTLTVEIDGRHVGVGAFASERIMVTS